MAVRIAINGFGRVGRTVLRALEARRTTSFENLRVVAVNDVADAATLAYLLRHDPVRGPFPAPVRTDGAHLTVDGRPVKVLDGRRPPDLPWAELGVTVVVEASGRFTGAIAARGHLAAGARRVVVAAPSPGADITVVMGVNDHAYEGQTLVSGADATTGCVALMTKVLEEAFGPVSVLGTTAHADTADLTAVLATPVTVAAVNDAFRRAAAAGLRGYLEYTDEPLVSGGVVGSPASCTFDAGLTRLLDDRTVTISGWYDNEWGYSHRIVDLVEVVVAAPPYAGYS